MKRLNAMMAMLPPSTGKLALTNLPRFVDGLYGKYATLPAAKVHDAYVTWCLAKLEQAREGVLAH